MDQIANWMQSNWYELGSLVAQFTFVFAGLWFAQKILKTMRASQQQLGALLRLSMTDGLEERSRISEAAPEEMSQPVHGAAPGMVASSMFSAPERPTSYAAFERPARTETPSLSSEWSGRGKADTAIASEPIAREPMTSTPITSAPDPTPYVAAPLTLPEDQHNGGHLAGVVQWLKTPMPQKQKGGSPLKKVVRWLQAPAR